jgi:hypothetical protein
LTITWIWQNLLDTFQPLSYQILNAYCRPSRPESNLIKSVSPFQKVCPPKASVLKIVNKKHLKANRTPFMVVLKFNIYNLLHARHLGMKLLCSSDGIWEEGCSGGADYRVECAMHWGVHLKDEFIQGLDILQA